MAKFGIFTRCCLFQKVFLFPLPSPPHPNHRNLCEGTWQLFFVRKILLCCLFCDTIVFEIDPSSFYKCKVSSRTFCPPLRCLYLRNVKQTLGKNLQIRNQTCQKLNATKIYRGGLIECKNLEYLKHTISS